MLTAELLGNACIALFAIMLGGAWRLHSLQVANKTLETELAKASKSLEEEKRRYADIVSKLREHYDERIKRNEGQVVEELDKAEPGWSTRHRLGEPGHRNLDGSMDVD